MKTHAQTAIYALEQMKGDNLARARAAFRGMTAKQLNEPHANAGMTRLEVLNGYETHDRKCDAAIAWIKTTIARRKKAEAKLDRVIHAIDEYHEALSNRQHGGVAQDKAFDAIREVFARPRKGR